MRSLITILIGLFMLPGCSILNPGYLSSRPDLKELKIKESSYADVKSYLGSPALTRITFGKSLDATWWYKTPSAEVDRIGMISGSYSRNCVDCGKLLLGFRWTSDDPTDMNSAQLMTIANESPALEKRHKTGEKALCHKNFEKAHKIMSSLAEKHYTPAEHNLGIMYIKGDGTQKDYEKAFNLFSRAARKGDAGAQYDLGVMYENGEYVQKDLRKAMALFKMSADQGNNDAASSLARLLQRHGKSDKAKKYRQMAKETPDPQFPESCEINNKS